MTGKNLGAISATFVLVFGFQQTVLAQESKLKLSFNHYLSTLKDEAKEIGIDERTIESSFPDIKLFRTAQDTNKAPFKEASSLDTYIPERVPEWKVEKARTFYKQYKTELEAIGLEYGVQPRFILALWGLESDFGADTSQYPLLSVVASRAYENPEHDEYKDEFFATLKILEQESLQVNELLGSSKGLLGQPKFLPSQYLTYAQDGNADGKKDLWNNPQDVFASLANYLKLVGWKGKETWGRQVLLPENFDEKHSSSAISNTFSQWTELGITRYNGNVLPKRDDMLVSLIIPDGSKGRAYLIYDNYRTLIKRMNSDYHALSVAYLSERIKYSEIN
ncbi:lytic murein transglycosylase [Shewanella sp. D64]|uniref:lytic murein transglycosylase n=1 Tax=unclassified Shewanella TaxID=196818 RepID=UPI0022BA387D|nr:MULTISPECIES: lytic murein transglycosylase [unclassified Shewanella]MEC4724345.1 lytic murein transglycosylase [Shewanella sp. D64]MEC4738857.1 lytic murein transglycosylase [Shewanella sp. E94]WBJ97706.1 lytic murein transglycosylase [Shewanella sp. MTB7]